MEEKSDQSKPQSRPVIPTTEYQDSGMDGIATRLFEIFSTLPDQPIKRVGWRWWYELQGDEDGDNYEFEVSGIERFEDWFDDFLEEMKAKTK